MTNWYTKEVETLFEAILTLRNVDECRVFFEDVCTLKELREISQRLQVAQMLRSGTSYAVINAQTGVSTATISRVSRCLEYGPGGYDLVMSRMEKEAES